MKLQVSWGQRRWRSLLRSGVCLVVFSLLRLGTASTASATAPPRSDKTVLLWTRSARIPDTHEACSSASISTTATGEPCLSSFSCRAKTVVTPLASSVLWQSPPRGGGQPSNRPRGDDDWHDNHKGNDPRRRPSSKASSSSSSSSSSLWSRLAKQSAKLSGQAISATARGSGQVAYALLRPKHVEYPELIGLWRLDQWIEGDSDSDNSHHHSDATRTLELTEQFTVLFSRPPAPPSNTLSTTTTAGNVSRDSTAKQKQRQHRQIPLEFHPAHWPSLATLSFYDDTTKLYYKCTVQRKMADPKVLKLRGKIYKLRSRGGGVSFWKTQNNQQQVISLASIQKKDLIPIGTFVGRRRMKLLTENSNNDDDENQDDQDQESDWESDVDDYNDNGGDETTAIQTDKDEQGLPSDSWDFDDKQEEGEGAGDKDEYDDADQEEEEDGSDR